MYTSSSQWIVRSWIKSRSSPTTYINSYGCDIERSGENSSPFSRRTSTEMAT